MTKQETSQIITGDYSRVARSNLTRRAILGAGLGVVGAAAVGGCSGESRTTGAIEGQRAKPPVYVPFNAVKPDLPGTDTGVLPGYFRYPANPPRVLTGQIGNGKPVEALLQGSAIGTPKARNQWWQSLNKAMNIDLNITQVPVANYVAKLQITAVGGDFPDMAQIVPIPGLPQILSQHFVDLSDYLGGDKVKEYPALAALPPSAWTAGSLNGHLYGLAQPRALAGVALTTRQDILDDLGIGEPTVSNGDDFLALCKELTDPKSHRWAFGAQPNAWLLNGMLEMMGAPNGWSVSQDGRFTAVMESDVYPEALEMVRRIWESGYVHPDSFANPASNQPWWFGGTTVLFYQGFDWWPGFQLQHPDKKLRAIVQPKWNGGGPARKHLAAGHYGAYIAIKKADDQRIEELLRVWNYLAAPYGSQEYLDVNYGVPGHDYTLDNGNPVQSKTGLSEYIQSLVYVGSTGFSVLYVPHNEEVVTKAHEYLTQTVPNGLPNPTVGLYSESELSKGAAARKTFNDLTSDIIQGRKPVSALSDGVTAWKRTVGDAARKEYEAAYEEANS